MPFGCHFGVSCCTTVLCSSTVDLLSRGDVWSSRELSRPVTGVPQRINSIEITNRS